MLEWGACWSDGGALTGAWLGAGRELARGLNVVPLALRESGDGVPLDLAFSAVCRANASERFIGVPNPEASGVGLAGGSETGLDSALAAFSGVLP
ncbi:MAG: hypothetical protein ACI835_000038 [Planctomycetota bacterium]|jgi:hypothetical protein